MWVAPFFTVNRSFSIFKTSNNSRVLFSLNISNNSLHAWLLVARGVAEVVGVVNIPGHIKIFPSINSSLAVHPLLINLLALHQVNNSFTVSSNKSRLVLPVFVSKRSNCKHKTLISSRLMKCNNLLGSFQRNGRNIANSSQFTLWRSGCN